MLQNKRQLPKLRVLIPQIKERTIVIQLNTCTIYSKKIQDS